MSLPVVPIATTDSPSQIRAKVAELATELNALGAGGGGGGATDLSYTASPTNGIVASSTGTDATLTLATTTNAGLMSPADKALMSFNKTRFMELFTDFVHNATFDPFGLTAFSSGSIAAQNGTADRIGIQALRDSATANGGVVIGTSNTAIRLQGNELFQLSFQWRDSRVESVARIGFHDGLSALTPVDGCWFELIGTATGFTMSAVTSNNSTQSTTPTPSEDFTGVTSTWYTFEVSMNADATVATFNVYEDPSAVAVWTKTLNTNIPTASDRMVGAGALVYETTTSAAASIIHADWMRLVIPRTLNR